jgi:hypothetical protein
LAPSSGRAEEPSLEAVEFLAGAWGADGTIVEYWLPPMRGLMVGLNREPSGSGMPFFEYLRIEAREDGIYYVASPKGTGTTDFKLTDSSSNRAVFENPEHDFPQKIAYTRKGNRMHVEVTAQKDGEWSGFSLDWEAMNVSDPR